MKDTVTSMNILDEDAQKKVGMPKLTKHEIRRLQPYGGGPQVKVMDRWADGNYQLLTCKDIQCHPFYVVSRNHGTLSGYSTAKNLGLFHIVNSIKHLSDK